MQEALAIILDVGPEMHQGSADGPTFFELSLTAIGMILQRKVFYLECLMAVYSHC